MIEQVINQIHTLENTPLSHPSNITQLYCVVVSSYIYEIKKAVVKIEIRNINDMDLLLKAYNYAETYFLNKE